LRKTIFLSALLHSTHIAWQRRTFVSRATAMGLYEYNVDTAPALFSAGVDMKQKLKVGARTKS